MPANSNLSIIAGKSDAGPMVQTIFVLFGGRFMGILLKNHCAHHRMLRGCPVEARTLLQSHPSGSIFFFLDTAREMGTWVNSPRQNPTTMFVRPVIPACTALWPRRRQKAESWGVAGTLLMVCNWGRCI